MSLFVHKPVWFQNNKPHLILNRDVDLDRNGTSCCPVSSRAGSGHFGADINQSTFTSALDNGSEPPHVSISSQTERVRRCTETRFKQVSSEVRQQQLDSTTHFTSSVLHGLSNNSSSTLENDQTLDTRKPETRLRIFLGLFAAGFTVRGAAVRSESLQQNRRVQQHKQPQAKGGPQPETNAFWGNLGMDKFGNPVLGNLGRDNCSSLPGQKLSCKGGQPV
ncbi:hypothetical protein Q8A73_004003 [Channa argus]|nr:hypothetical protein Q8A73_004003 [Channa argus]